MIIYYKRIIKSYKNSSFNNDSTEIYTFLSNRNKPSSPTSQFDFNSSTFFKSTILFLFQGYFHFFYTIKISLYYIIKRTSLYIKNINSNVINNLAILISNFLPINIDLFTSMSTIVFYYPLVRLIWFDYKIYNLRFIIPTINTN